MPRLMSSGINGPKVSYMLNIYACIILRQTPFGSLIPLIFRLYVDTGPGDVVANAKERFNIRYLSASSSQGVPGPTLPLSCPNWSL